MTESGDGEGEGGGGTYGHAPIRKRHLSLPLRGSDVTGNACFIFIIIIVCAKLRVSSSNQIVTDRIIRFDAPIPSVEFSNNSINRISVLLAKGFGSFRLLMCDINEVCIQKP